MSLRLSCSLPVFQARLSMGLQLAGCCKGHVLLVFSICFMVLPVFSSHIMTCTKYWGSLLKETSCKLYNNQFPRDTFWTTTFLGNMTKVRALLLHILGKYVGHVFNEKRISACISMTRLSDCQQRGHNYPKSLFFFHNNWVTLSQLIESTWKYFFSNSKHHWWLFQEA